MLAAEASIEARDRLLESLDAADAARVQAWVTARTAKPFPLGVRGQLATTPDGREECRLSVKGVTHPELLAGLQYQSFKAPKSEIVRLLDLSRKVGAVMEARWTIRTAFSQGMWDSVVFMTSGMCRGSSADFPPYPIQKN